MVFVVVGVLVHVAGGVMVMCVEMVGSKRQADTERGDPHGDHLDCVDRVGQHDPRQQCPEERGSREDHLTACCAELLRAAHPQRDRRSVAERADDQRTDHRPAVHVSRPADDQPECEVDAACHGPFQEDDMLRAD